MSIAQEKSLYRRTLTKTVYIRRYTGTGANRPYFDTLAHAQVVGASAEALIGAINQYDYDVILLAEDLINGQFALPITNADRIVIGGKEHAIMFPDGATRSNGDELIGYQIKARG